MGNETLMAYDGLFEKHYRVAELAQLWGLGRETVRKIVREPGTSSRLAWAARRRIPTYSVPESAARRMHTRAARPFLRQRYKLWVSACRQMLHGESSLGAPAAQAPRRCNASRPWPQYSLAIRQRL